jgi:hypothetical protein
MQDYNIEFAHIYADKKFGEEQQKSIEILKKTLKKLKNNSIVTCILIDEISPEKNSLNFEMFKQKILSFNVPLDYVAYESTLSTVAEWIMGQIPAAHLKTEKFGKKEVILLVNHNVKIGLKEKSGKYSCSLLIAAWILCRLGLCKSNTPVMDKLSQKPFEAKELITILPEKYRKTEHKVWEILKISNFKDSLDKLEYIFF